MAVKADTRSIVDVLNELRAAELAVIVQYMRHHYVATGVDGITTTSKM